MLINIPQIGAGRQQTYAIKFFTKSNSLLVFFVHIFCFVFELVQSRLIAASLLYMVDGRADAVNLAGRSSQ